MVDRLLAPEIQHPDGSLNYDATRVLNDLGIKIEVPAGLYQAALDVAVENGSYDRKNQVLSQIASSAVTEALVQTIKEAGLDHVVELEENEFSRIKSLPGPEYYGGHGAIERRTLYNELIKHQVRNLNQEDHKD